jgi:hypothetical protein
MLRFIVYHYSNTLPFVITTPPLSTPIPSCKFHTTCTHPQAAGSCRTSCIYQLVGVLVRHRCLSSVNCCDANTIIQCARQWRIPYVAYVPWGSATASGAASGAAMGAAMTVAVRARRVNVNFMLLDDRNDIGFGLDNGMDNGMVGRRSSSSAHIAQSHCEFIYQNSVIKLDSGAHLADCVLSFVYTQTRDIALQHSARILHPV